MNFSCFKCQKKYPLNTLKYKCDCGGLFVLENTESQKTNYKITLGEVATPVLIREFEGLKINLKLDYLMPTGSFKDRGALTLINQLSQLGIKEVVEDSSGNAGASIAAYCAAADIKCNIFLPENTSQGKIKQITAYGANIIKVPGNRDATSAAVLKAACNIYYASHVYNPLFLQGTKSIAQEILAQIGFPDYVFVPVGNGTMLLGVYLGFLELGKIPKIIAVQSKNCSPIYNHFNNLPNYRAQQTLAEGIAVGTPMRMNEIIAALKNSNGEVVTVSEGEIANYYHKLSKLGIYTEPTSSATLAGAINYFNNKKIRPGTDAKIVIPLTGSGLKK
ncbi:MAG: pyridoxal-phosphate dependent enzyme [Peptococcaceae bacterium]